MADFSFNLLYLSNNNVDFLNFMKPKDLYLLLSVPTRNTGQSATLVDVRYYVRYLRSFYRFEASLG